MVVLKVNWPMQAKQPFANIQYLLQQTTHAAAEGCAYHLAMMLKSKLRADRLEDQRQAKSRNQPNQLRMINHRTLGLGACRYSSSWSYSRFTAGLFWNQGVRGVHSSWTKHPATRFANSGIKLCFFGLYQCFLGGWARAGVFAKSTW